MPKYRFRLLAATREGIRFRLGGRWGGLTLAAPLLIGGAIGFAISGNDPVTTNSLFTALVAGLFGVGVWVVFIVLWSAVQAPGVVDAQIRGERDRIAAELDQYRRFSFRLTPIARSEMGASSASASLWVENVGKAEARNCRGRLIGLSYIGRERRTNLDVPLSWAHPDHPDDPSRKTFHHGAELEVAVHSTPNHMIPAAAYRRTVADPRMVELIRDADLILGIEIAPEGAAATVGWFRLKWWSFVQIKQDDGSIVHYDLHGAEIEFEDADPQSSSAAISSQVHT
jgi:hypothetical protein